MVMSTIKPDVIEIDYVKNGVANILVHWNFEEVIIDDEKLWSYEECSFRGKNGWVLPEKFDTFEDVKNYFEIIENEILDWAKGSRTNLNR